MTEKMALVLLALLAERVWKLYKHFRQIYQQIDEDCCRGTDEGANQVATESPFILGFSICAICRALVFLFAEMI